MRVRHRQLAVVYGAAEGPAAATAVLQLPVLLLVVVVLTAHFPTIGPCEQLMAVRSRRTRRRKRTRRRRRRRGAGQLQPTTLGMRQTTMMLHSTIAAATDVVPVAGGRRCHPARAGHRLTCGGFGC
jgi:hypothetical protein